MDRVDSSGQQKRECSAGPGILRFARDLELTGPLTVRHGVLRNTGASVTKPFGAGDVVLESGTLSTVEAPADRTCGTVAYRRAPVVEIGTGLTAAALRREGHGVLFVRHPVAHGVLGESASFRVASGVTAQPVFFVDNDGNIGFLAYDSDRGFVRAASGPSAALVLNNTSPGGACRAEGGTVDFGAAEGLVLATASVSAQFADLYTVNTAPERFFTPFTSVLVTLIWPLCNSLVMVRATVSVEPDAVSVLPSSVRVTDTVWSFVSYLRPEMGFVGTVSLTVYSKVLLVCPPRSAVVKEISPKVTVTPSALTR